MVNKRSKAGEARKRRRRSKIRLLLTDQEVAVLDHAVAESGAWSRSLVIAAAIRSGLANTHFELTQERRCRRVDLWISKNLMENVKQLAFSHTITHQRLLRYFLFDYLAHAPWNTPTTSSDDPTETEVDRV